MFAKLARFYGWDHDKILQMDFEDADFYWRAITIIEAQETMLNLKVSTYPHSKKEDMKKFHRQMHQLAYPSVHREEISLEELSQRLRLELNG